MISACLLATTLVHSLNNPRMVHGRMKMIPWTKLRSMVYTYPEDMSKTTGGESFGQWLTRHLRRSPYRYFRVVLVTHTRIPRSVSVKAFSHVHCAVPPLALAAELNCWSGKENGTNVDCFLETSWPRKPETHCDFPY